MIWNRIKEFFHHSETIFLARLWMVLGVALSVIETYDPHLIASLFPPEWTPYIIVGIGLLTEFARKYRADDLNKKG